VSSSKRGRGEGRGSKKKKRGRIRDTGKGILRIGELMATRHAGTLYCRGGEEAKRIVAAIKQKCKGNTLDLRGGGGGQNKNCNPRELGSSQASFTTDAAISGKTKIVNQSDYTAG